MNFAGYIALFVIFGLVCTKIFFGQRIRNYEFMRTVENKTFQNTQNKLHKIQQQNKIKDAEIRQLDARKKTTQRNIDNITKTRNELRTRKQNDDAEREYQSAIIRGEKPQ